MRIDTVKTTNIGVVGTKVKRGTETLLEAAIKMPEGVSMRLRGKAKDMKKTYWAVQSYNRAHRYGCKVQFINGIVYITKPMQSHRRKEDNDNKENTTKSESIASKVSQLPCFSTTAK